MAKGNARKLSDEKVIEIAKDYILHGKSVVDTSKRTDVPKSTIWYNLKYILPNINVALFVNCRTILKRNNTKERHYARLQSKTTST